jgi:hypothetical protein
MAAKLQAMIAQLGEGLTLRRSTAADAEQLAAFNASVHVFGDNDSPTSRIAAWTRDLLSGRHGTTVADDFTIVEDGNGRIVSATVLIPQTWTYQASRLTWAASSWSGPRLSTGAVA